MISRRTLLACGASVAAWGKAPAGLKIGVMDGCFRMQGKPEALEAAARLGFDGIQVTLGRPGPDGRLPLADAALQARYLDAVKKHRMPLSGTYLDVLHVNCLKSDPKALGRVRDGIEITRRLKARILMLVFFGECALYNQAEMDAVVGPLKELAPEAARAGVVLGFENLLKCEDNERVLDKVGSKALKVYYDVGNATNMVGVDAPAEIRRLGKRICQFHIKDKGYLGEGKVDLAACMKAIGDIGFRGFANLETGSPGGSVEGDLKRNLEFTRRSMTA